jgi:hypothetical protein
MSGDYPGFLPSMALVAACGAVACATMALLVVLVSENAAERSEWLKAARRVLPQAFVGVMAFMAAFWLAGRLLGLLAGAVLMVVVGVPLMVKAALWSADRGL